MGLKNKLNKMKSFLFDEEVVKEDKKEQKKEKKHKKEIEEPVFEEPDIKATSILEEDDYSYNFDSDFENLPKKEDIERESRQTRVEKQEFTIPELTDDDFMFPQKEEPTIVEPVIEQPLLYQGSRKRKEEGRRFKPSPNISPVYGLLDENGNHITDDKKTVDIALNNQEEMSIDDVRKKAYGTLDEKIEKVEKKKEETKADEEVESKEPEEKLSRKSRKEKVKEVEEDELSTEESDDDMILPSINFKEINVDEKVDKKEDTSDEEDDDEETKEQDLFNLIETVYPKDGDE